MKTRCLSVAMALLLFGYASPLVAQELAKGDEAAAKRLDAQITELREASARSGNRCLAAQFIAISDERVREEFLKTIGQGHVFQGVRCLSQPINLRYIYVLYQFECAPDLFCLIPPSFLVTVDMWSKTVVKIEPYIADRALAAAVEEDRTCCGDERSSARASGCSADIQVTADGDEVIVTGSVDCGVKCDLDARLSPANPSAEVQCTAGVLRTIVRLTLDGGCVVVEGKACVKNFGGGWSCSGWNDLGKFCP